MCELKSLKNHADLCLDKTRFLVIARRKQPILSTYGMGTLKVRKTLSLLSLSIFSKASLTENT